MNGARKFFGTLEALKTQPRNFMAFGNRGLITTGFAISDGAADARLENSPASAGVNTSEGCRNGIVNGRDKSSHPLSQKNALGCCSSAF